MKIIEISSSNLAEHLDQLITLNEEFLGELGSPQDRTHEEKIAILKKMVSAEYSTVLLKVEDEDGKPAGISYYNYGTGYSCGGTYLWLNAIYIRKEYQRKGYGSRLIDYIEAGACKREVKLFICGRAPENEASRRLFGKMGFGQNDGVVMTKEYKPSNEVADTAAVDAER